MLLAVESVAKSFGAHTILSGASFRVDRGEKLALVGRNGTGKTTLLRIILGHAEPDAGRVHLLRGARVGYLSQTDPVTAGRSVLEEAESAVAGRVELRRRLEELERKLADSPTGEDVEAYALAHEHFIEGEAYACETDVRTVLARMGFAEHEFAKSTQELSGGEKTRLAIAKLLLDEPDLLVLDEPTNHLDLEATEWLEHWIRTYRGAVLLVSHDRTFLESTVQRVVLLRDGEAKSYAGGFDKFLRLRDEEEARQAKVAERQASEIAKLDEFVRRFMNSQRTAEARGRQRRLEKLVAEQVEAPRADRTMKARLGPTRTSGDIVVEARALSVGYGDTPLVRGLDWTVRRGERWGVVGANGIGKSTLVRTLLGLLPPLAGTCRLGSKVDVGYFSQDAEDLDLDASPIEVLIEDAGLKPGPARDLLGRFLLSGDDVFRPVRTLSGGERNKLALARITALRPNLLVADEPTNHLDMDSREALGAVWSEFEGTLILVSHDRRLLGAITNHTLDLRRSGPVRFGGSYAEYRARTPLANTAQPPAPRVEEQRGLSPREVSKEIARLSKLVADAEDRVAAAEAAVAQLEAELASADPSADLLSLTRRHSELTERLRACLQDWEERSSQLESLHRMR